MAAHSLAVLGWKFCGKFTNPQIQSVMQSIIKDFVQNSAHWLRFYNKDSRYTVLITWWSAGFMVFVLVYRTPAAIGHIVLYRLEQVHKKSAILACRIRLRKVPFCLHFYRNFELTILWQWDCVFTVFSLHILSFAYPANGTIKPFLLSERELQKSASYY